MLSFGWSPLVRQLPSPPGLLIILQLLCQEHQTQLVQSSLTCSTAFQFSSKVEVLILLFKFFQFYSLLSRDGKVDNYHYYHYYYYYHHHRVWSGYKDLGSIPGRVIPKTLKMELDTTLLNTQHYKVRFKVKWSNPGNGVAPSPTPWCSSYRKGSLRVTLDYGLLL